MLLFSSVYQTVSAIENLDDFERESLKLGQQMEKLEEVLDEKSVDFWIKRTKQNIKTEKISLNNAELLNFDNTRVYRIKDTPYIAIGVPIVSSDYLDVSSVSIYYNEKTRNIETFTEIEFKRSELDTLEIIVSVDGVVNTHEITDDTFPLTDNESEVSILIDWDGVGDCLGISGVTARWLSYICGATCVITLGTACVICISAAIGITGGTVGACIGNNI